jgi:putative ABC transport system permease protein
MRADHARRLLEWMRRLLGTLRAGRQDDDLDEELRAHIALAEEDARRRGLDPRAATRSARLEAGGAAQAMESLRDQRGLPWLEDLAADVRYGARMLWRSPPFAAVALVTLALGIGANTAVFSVVHGVILQPLVYPDPGQLMRVAPYGAAAGSGVGGLSYPEYEELRAMNRSFAQLGAFTTGRANTGGGSGSWTGEVNLTAGGRPLRVRSAAVDEYLLQALGVQPAHGRIFGPGETDAMADRPGLGGPPVAIVSHELWQSAFDGQPLVGRAVDVDGRPHEVIGIMPPGVDLMDHRPEIWLPLGAHPAIRRLRTSHVLDVIGRLRDGVTAEAARAELDGFLENWADRAGTTGHVPAARPSGDDAHTVRLQPLRDAIVGDASRAIWVLQAAVGLVLLIGCANLANVAMARAASRRRELAVRAALGASRGRLLRQTMTEGVLLSAGGGLLGVWLAHAGVRALVLAHPASLPRTSEVSIDVPVLLFATGVSLGTGLLFGLAPLAQRRPRDVAAVLKAGGDRGASSGGRHHVRRALVTLEVALAMMLVVGAGLLLRTVGNLTRVDAGFDRSRLVTFSMTVPRGASEGGGRAEVYQRLLDTLRAAPGVVAATAMSELPLDRVVQRFATRVERGAPTTGATAATAAAAPTTEVVDYYQFVMSGYFETMGIPIVAGRGFDHTDAASLERVVVVSETLADRFWRGRNPIGARLRPNLSASLGTGENPWHTVVGVAKDVKEGGVDRDPGTELYLFVDQPAPRIDGAASPWEPTAPPRMHVALRTSLAPAALAQTLDDAVRAVAPAVPVVRLREMDAVFAESIGRQRLLSQLLGGFAGLALLLAAVGTYGVLACLVAERRREIGIRMALGAARARVIALVMREGLHATLIGIVIGLAGAVGVSRLMSSLLFGVQPTDPATFAAVVATIAAVAAIACWVPAWRASRLDPNVVLRAD